MDTLLLMRNVVYPLFDTDARRKSTVFFRTVCACVLCRHTWLQDVQMLHSQMLGPAVMTRAMVP